MYNILVAYINMDSIINLNMIMTFTWEWNGLTIVSVCVAGVVICCLLAYLIMSLFYAILRKRAAISLSLNTSDTKVIIYNLKEKTIRFFDKRDISHPKVTTADAFFASFGDRKIIEQIQTWIDSYVNGDGTESSFLTVKSRLTNLKKDCISIYRITSYNPKLQILHFENSVLPDVIVRKNSKKEYSYVRKISDMESICRSMQNANSKYGPCICFYIKLIPYLSNIDGSDTKTRSLYVTSIYQPLNGIQKLLSKKRLLSLINDKEAAIFDFSLNYRTDVISFCNLLLGEIQRYFSIKSLNNLYDVSIGVSYYENSGSFEQTLQKAKLLSDKAGDNESIKFLIEGDGEESGSYSDSSSASDIAALIKNKTYRIYYTPIISKSLNGNYFLVDIQPYGITKSTSFIDLVTLSDKFGIFPDLLDSVSVAFNEVASSNYRHKFIVKMPMSKISKIGKFFAETKNSISKEVAGSIVLMFNKDEVHDFYEADSNLISHLNSLKAFGLQLCLSFSDTLSVDSPKDILSVFDLFLIVTDNLEAIHQDQRKISRLISVYSILSSYNRPLIISGVGSISDIKIASKLGYSSFISDKLAGASSSLYLPDVYWSDTPEDDGEDLKV